MKHFHFPFCFLFTMTPVTVPITPERLLLPKHYGTSTLFFTYMSLVIGKGSPDPPPTKWGLRKEGSWGGNSGPKRLESIDYV